MVRPVLLAALALMAAIRPAHAQFAVFDAATVGQLITELKTLEQQLQTARAHLAETQAQFRAMTGGRGMELLVAGAVRNYLPSDWAMLLSTTQGTGGSYSGLSVDVQAALRANAVLSEPQLASLPAGGAKRLQQRRQSIALAQAIAHAALANSSNRFGALQQLINAIAGASDQKASLDLNARIAAEQGMLQNEQTKLQVLYQGALAAQWASEQRLREEVIVAHGSFVRRFQPVP
jgi:type IV secretion system protein VirB5